ncbi:hypothetical protein AOX56_02070 [Aeromonas sobria]|uniref:Uncharacterized protein n=1 Tax=Aeromonas sobria TaxID=646 RepID=A0A2N3J7X5_AERSO|nr:hypothetical protein [Aeromonas sobria]PKQ82637.1 hypothetical protein AOX56_02070 [Aeromonas sobria]HEH9439898.1 hypothetical protein [Aeromonas sobria]
MRYLLLLPLLWTLPAQANNEAKCQQEFVDWMLHQQQQFSDRKSDKMERRRAERAIELARQEYDKQTSFCKTMALVRSYKDSDPRFKPRTGEIHDFAPAS